MQIFVNSNYNFVKWRFTAVAFSVLVMIIGAVQYMRHGFNMGIDFAGGANIVLKFRDEVPMDSLRTELPGASTIYFLFYRAHDAEAEPPS